MNATMGKATMTMIFVMHFPAMLYLPTRVTYPTISRDGLGDGNRVGFVSSAVPVRWPRVTAANQQTCCQGDDMSQPKFLHRGRTIQKALRRAGLKTFKVAQTFLSPWRRKSLVRVSSLPVCQG